MVAAVAGVTVDENVVTIGHIAGRSDLRGHGYGGALVRALVRDVAPLPIVAQTDDDAVGYYRKVGFAVSEVDSPWETTRYRCVLG